MVVLVPPPTLLGTGGSHHVADVVSVKQKERNTRHGRHRWICVDRNRIKATFGVGKAEVWFDRLQ